MKMKVSVTKHQFISGRSIFLKDIETVYDWLQEKYDTQEDENDLSINKLKTQVKIINKQLHIYHYQSFKGEKESLEEANNTNLFMTNLASTPPEKIVLLNKETSILRHNVKQFVYNIRRTKKYYELEKTNQLPTAEWSELEEMVGKTKLARFEGNMAQSQKYMTGKHRVLLPLNMTTRDGLTLLDLGQTQNISTR